MPAYWLSDFEEPKAFVWPFNHRRRQLCSSITGTYKYGNKENFRNKRLGEVKSWL